MLVAVTDHAAERFRQRVGSRTGAVDVKPEVTERVMRAHAAGRHGTEPPPGASGARGSVYVQDLRDRGVVYVCRPQGPHELVVVTLWERDDGRVPPRVPREFTRALKHDDHLVRDRRPEDG